MDADHVGGSAETGHAEAVAVVRRDQRRDGCPVAVVVVAGRRRRPLRSVRSDVVEAVDLACEIGHGVDAGVDDPDLDTGIAPP